jgi:hypothetical protein
MIEVKRAPKGAAARKETPDDWVPALDLHLFSADITRGISPINKWRLSKSCRQKTKRFNSKRLFMI